MTLDAHLAKGGEAWAWHVNKFADELAVVTALSNAPFVTKETHDWILGRTERLTERTRIKYWLTQEADLPKPVPDGPPRAKLDFFRQAKTKCFGGHIWVASNQGLHCTACLSVLKQYRLLSDLEVLASLPRPGAGTEMNRVWAPPFA